MKTLVWPYVNCNCTDIITINDLMWVDENRPDITIWTCDCGNQSPSIKDDDYIKLKNLIMIKDIIE